MQGLAETADSSQIGKREVGVREGLIQTEEMESTSHQSCRLSDSSVNPKKPGLKSGITINH